jgi:tellurium resistance protein TerD
MALNLVKKGERVALGLSKLVIGLGWNPNQNASSQNFDLDVSTFLLGSNGKLLGEDFLVFYNSEKTINTPEGNRPCSPCEGVIGSLDDQTGDESDGGDDETVDVDLNKVDPRVEEIIITVSLHDFDIRKQNFGQVRNAYELDEDFSSESAVEFGRLYKRNNEWKFEAIGRAYPGGLQTFVDKYL